MASNNPSSSSTNLRFLGVLKQPAASDPTDLDLDENDVFWSFIPSSTSYSFPNSTSPTPPSIHNRRRSNNLQSGLSAALEDVEDNLISRRSMAIPAITRMENIPVNFRQSAPVNITMWPKMIERNDNESFDLEEFDDEEEKEGEMVPPHVIVARSHMTFSVFEGLGRTLKGRDLRRVRNAVFQKTGFID